MNFPPLRPAARLSFLALVLLGAFSGWTCQLPGPHSDLVTADRPSVLLDRCTLAVRAMHFDVKAVDRSHLIVVAEGKIEGDLAFHTVRLSIKVVHLEGSRYRVEATATSDERGIRAGVEQKARQHFFRELKARDRATP